MTVTISKLIATFAILLNIGLAANGFSLLTATVYVSDGGSFFQYVANSEAEITNCSAEFVVNSVRITFVLDMKTISEPTVSPNFQDEINLTQRVRSLGEGKCGFRLENATSSDPDSWTLRGSGGSTDNSATFRVLFYASRIMRSTQQVTVGLRGTIACGSQDLTESQLFCELYNPRGQFVSWGNNAAATPGTATRCLQFIGVITMEDLGTWHCIVGVLHSFEVLKYVVDVVDEAHSVEGWVDEFDDRVDIGCRINGLRSSATYCRMISPQGQELVLRPGLAVGRYTTFNTNLQNSVCSMQIAKPLVSEDSGIWRCNITNMGVPLQVGSRMVYARGSTSTSVELQSSFIVKCVVPYSSTNCFITSPVGTRYLPSLPSQTQLGECIISLVAEAEHNGTWKCHFFTENNPTPNAVNFEVLVTNGLSCTKEVATTIGDNAEFACNNPRTPLQYCWFISPNNETFQLDENVNTTRISYVGRGIKYGDCGIRINGVQPSEIGDWTCTLMMGNYGSGTQSTTTLKLSVTSGTSLAAVLGASIGVSVAVIVIFGTLLYRKWKRNRPADAELELSRRPSISSGSSEERFNRQF